MLKKKLEIIFISVILIAIVILLNNWYSSYSFNSKPISNEYQKLIDEKEQEVLYNMQNSFGIRFQVPLIITDKIPGKLYGVTSLDRDGSIKIFLNKKVMKESMTYILENVIAHEYAHALLFKKGYARNGDGHSKLWQETCTKLGGINCQKYVDSHDVIMGKMPF